VAGRKSVPLSVQEQHRRVHRSNAEKEARAEAEASIEVQYLDVQPPSFLNTKAKKDKFMSLAEMLQSVNEQLCTELDTDTLARYVSVESDYVYYQKELNRAKREKKLDEIDRFERLKNTAFKQVETLSSKLLLEPAARARAAMVKQEAPKENAFAEFAGGR